MSELARRLVPACFLAVILHAVVLAWWVRQEEPLTLPAPLAVQRIAVSLGARSVAKESPLKPEQEAKQEKEVIPPPEPEPEPQPEPKPSKTRPIVKPVVQPVAKPELVKKQQAVSPPEPVKLLMDTPIVPEKEPPPLHTEIGDKSTKAEIAAHVIQQAAPLYQVNPPPKYPRLARRRGLEGLVVLEVLVDVLGRVKDFHIFESSGHSVLDRAAVKAVRRWKFNAGTVGGTVKDMWVKVPVRFRLKGE